MPFKSEAQRRYLWLKHPDVAKKWAHEPGAKNKGLPMHKGKTKFVKKGGKVVAQRRSK